MVIDKIKSLLGDLEGKDELLSTIIDLTESRLRSMIGADAVPEELEYIVTEVSVVRFNRIGSEGMQSHSVEGESITFKDDDFTAFQSDIDRWIDRQENGGRLRFL